MMNFMLFTSTVIIWGTTWIAIAWQIGPVDVIVSIFYRFALAGVVFLVALEIVIIQRHQNIPSYKVPPPS